MLVILEWVLLVFALVSSLLPLFAKRLAGPRYGEYAAFGTIFLTSAFLTTVSYIWFHTDIITAFVRSIILVALPYGSSLHWIDRRLLPRQQQTPPKEASS